MVTTFVEENGMTSGVIPIEGDHLFRLKLTTSPTVECRPVARV